MFTSNIVNIQSLNLTPAFPPCLCYTLTPQQIKTSHSNESYYWPTILTLLGILLWLNWSPSILNKLINLSMMTSLYEKFVSFRAQFKGPIIRKKLNGNICSCTILIGSYIIWSWIVILTTMATSTKNYYNEQYLISNWRY